MKCKDCCFCKIDYDKVETQMSAAKCILTSKKGKTIYWAFTTYDNITDARLGKVKEYGLDRVNKALENKESPFWCPIKKLVYSSTYGMIDPDTINTIYADLKITDDIPLTKEELNKKYAKQKELYLELTGQKEMSKETKEILDKAKARFK